LRFLVFAQDRFALRMRVGDRTFPVDNNRHRSNSDPAGTPEPEELAAAMEEQQARGDRTHGAQFALSLLDTGNEFYEINKGKWIEASDAFIICFTVDSASSFSMAQAFREEVLKAANYRFVPMVLAAGKCDVPESEREVNMKDAEELAQYYRCPFVEYSAKTGKGCFEVRGAGVVPGGVCFCFLVLLIADPSSSFFFLSVRMLGL
jgi:GTPase SAR1 family protein